MAIWFKLAILGLAALMFSSARAQDLVNVPVAIPAITPAAVTFAVARERGYFRKEGLDAQLIVMPSAIGTQALIGSNVKFSNPRQFGVVKSSAAVTGEGWKP
jgi:ABC-type nitrate/sulfonate/bicarbonate transport system substrate-binding protein